MKNGFSPASVLTPFMVSAATKFAQQAYNSYRGGGSTRVARSSISPRMSGYPSRGPSRAFRKPYRRTAALPSRTKKRIGYRIKRRQKRFTKRIQKSAIMSSPWKLNTYKSGVTWSGKGNGSKVYGFDLGLGNAAAALNMPGLPNGTSTLGDIYYPFALATASGGWGITNTNQKVAIYENELGITLRNQENFGCFLKVYYIKTPKNQAMSISTSDTINEFIASIFPAAVPESDAALAAAGDSTMTQNTDLTDYLSVPPYMTITSRKVYKFYPGETKTFKLRSGHRRGGIFNLRYLLNKTRGQYTRSIIFQITGFPGKYSGTDASLTTTAPINIDCVTMWRNKTRIIENDYQNSHLTETQIGDTTGQFQAHNWQSGGSNNAGPAT